MNPNQYVSVIPSRGTADGVADPIAPPDGNAQLTLWDYLALPRPRRSGCRWAARR